MEPVEEDVPAEEEAPVEEPADTKAHFVPSEQPTTEQPVVDSEGEPVDVTSVVDDLIAPGGEHPIVDAEVVEEPDSPSDEQLAQSVRDELAGHPSISAGQVSVEVRDGMLYLRGEIESPGLIWELDERVRELAGAERVRNLMHLPGNPPPG